MTIEKDLIEPVVKRRIEMVEERLVSLGITKENAHEYKLEMNNVDLLSPYDLKIDVRKWKKKVWNKTFTARMAAESLMWNDEDTKED